MLTILKELPLARLSFLGGGMLFMFSLLSRSIELCVELCLWKKTCTAGSWVCSVLCLVLTLPEVGGWLGNPGFPAVGSCVHWLFLHVER